MRRALDALYAAAAYLAALLLIGTLMMILLGIFGRLLDFQVRGSDAYAGYLMAGSGFLALAHTLKRGEHIRVSVVSRLLEGHAHKLLELIAIGIAVLLAIVLAWFSVRLAWLSFTLHDISTGTNGTCGSLCTAKTGYDYVTGLGAPKANNLIPALVAK